VAWFFLSSLLPKRIPNAQATVACETLKRVAEVSDKVRVLPCSVVIESVD
jgi:hypothetical protein